MWQGASRNRSEFRDREGTQSRGILTGSDNANERSEQESKPKKNTEWRKDFREPVYARRTICFEGGSFFELDLQIFQITVMTTKPKPMLTTIISLKMEFLGPKKLVVKIFKKN